MRYLWRLLRDGWSAESQSHYPTTAPLNLNEALRPAKTKNPEIRIICIRKERDVHYL